MIKSCYIHIPFCEKICNYCDFCKLYYNKKFINRYLDSLENEILNNYNGEVLDTIYIGGGTPSCLDIYELDRLFNIISNLKLSNNYEYTIEGNFNSTSIDKLKLYKKYGINRLSFGIESINKNNLSFLGRAEDKDTIINVINNARSLGFNNINVDLIYAIIGEDIDTLKEDLDFIVSLDVEHISTYSLMIEDNTILGINEIESIDQDIDSEMYDFICKYLKDNNYIHYEISNFSKKNMQSKHNLVYWNNLEYYGFGLSAASYIGNMRITNTKSITKYFENNYIGYVEELDIDDKEEYQVILNLRKSNGIDLDEFKKLFGIQLIDRYDYSELLKDKLLCLKDNYLFIPEDKWYISNEIIVRILGCDKYGL